MFEFINQTKTTYEKFIFISDANFIILQKIR